MNKLLFSNILGFLPKIKSAIFSDGKFNLNRSVILVVIAVIIAVGYAVIGPEGVAFVIDNLDEVSDIIGYDGD